MADVACVRVVRRADDRWAVTQRGLDWFLAEFSAWEDALDYARSLAVTSHEAILEGEDRHGRVALRQAFSTDAGGVIRIHSLTVA
jgi:hypothetical protein